MVDVICKVEKKTGLGKQTKPYLTKLPNVKHFHTIYNKFPVIHNKYITVYHLQKLHFKSSVGIIIHGNTIKLQLKYPSVPTYFLSTNYNKIIKIKCFIIENSNIIHIYYTTLKCI